MSTPRDPIEATATEDAEVALLDLLPGTLGMDRAITKALDDLVAAARAEGRREVLDEVSPPPTRRPMSTEPRTTDNEPRVRAINFDRCQVCDSMAVVRLPDDWQEQERAIPVIACGNPWHYATRSLGDAPLAAERASGGLDGVHGSVMEAMSRVAESKVDASDEYKRGWIDALGAISGELARLTGGQDDE